MSTPNVDVSKLVPGDRFYRVVHYTVTKVDGNSVDTKSDTAGLSTISTGLVECSAFSTNQYSCEEKLTRTQLAQKIETLGHAAFRVTFHKAVSANDVADALEEDDGDDPGTDAKKIKAHRTKRRKLLKETMKGKERVMHCKLYRTDAFDASIELGRYQVIDLEVFDQN